MIVRPLVHVHVAQADDGLDPGEGPRPPAIIQFGIAHRGLQVEVTVSAGTGTDRRWVRLEAGRRVGERQHRAGRGRSMADGALLRASRSRSTRWRRRRTGSRTSPARPSSNRGRGRGWSGPAAASSVATMARPGRCRIRPMAPRLEVGAVPRASGPRPQAVGTSLGSGRGRLSGPGGAVAPVSGPGTNCWPPWPPWGGHGATGTGSGSTLRSPAVRAGRLTDSTSRPGRADPPLLHDPLPNGPLCGARSVSEGLCGARSVSEDRGSGPR